MTPIKFKSSQVWLLLRYFKSDVGNHTDHQIHYYPARACASKGLCDRSWCLCICKTFSYLSKYSLSDAHFSTGRLLFQFNRLQYTLAAPEVFVSSANPVILPSGYRVSIVRNTNIDQIETTPLRYCMHARYG